MTKSLLGCAPANHLIGHLKSPKTGVALVGVGLAVAGLFTLLAALTILPSGANAISNWGYGLETGIALISVGLAITLLTVLYHYKGCRKKPTNENNRVLPRTKQPPIKTTPKVAPAQKVVLTQADASQIVETKNAYTAEFEI